MNTGSNPNMEAHLSNHAICSEVHQITHESTNIIGKTADTVQALIRGEGLNSIHQNQTLQQKLNITPRPIESIAIQTEPRPVRTLLDVLSILDWAPEELKSQTDEFALKLIEFLAEHNMLDKVTKKPLRLEVGGNEILLSLGRLALERELQGWTVSDKDREENPEYYKQYSERPTLYKERPNKAMLAPEYLKQSDTYGRHWDAGVLYKDLLDTSDPSLKNALASKKAEVWLCLKTNQDRNIEEISNLPIPRINIARLGAILLKK